MKKIVAIALLLSLMLAILSGCSSAVVEGNETNTDAYESDGNSEINYNKDTLNYGVLYSQSSWDPCAISDGKSNIVMTLVYDNLIYSARGLYTFDEVEPCLAKSWEVSDDGLTYTFHLRDDVVFNNGDKLTSEDVVYSLFRTRDESINGAEAWAIVDDITADDDYTVTITLTEPNADFLSVSVGIASASILNKKAMEAQGDLAITVPVGTGRYVLEGEYVPGHDFSLVANPSYWGDQSFPIKRINFIYLPDANTACIALQNGEVDLIGDFPASSVSSVSGDPNVKIVEGPSYWFNYLTFNKKEGSVFADERVRRAVNYAIDRQAALDGSFDGHGELAKCCIRAGDLGHLASLPDNEYDVEKAKQLLAEAGYPDGFSTTLLCRTDRSYMLAACQVIQSELKEIGITVEIEQIERLAWNERVDKADFEFLIDGESWTTAAQQIPHIYSSTGGRNFDKTINDPQIDEWLAQAAQVTDTKTRQDLYEKVQQKVYDNCWTVPLYFTDDMRGCASDLMGVTITKTSLEEFWKYYFAA